MTFSAGTRLGLYEITGLLGSGGMGEVYQATDTKLGRFVAIKVLPDLLAQDAERALRFEREARVLAAGLEEAVLDRPTVVHQRGESPLRRIHIERCSNPDAEVVSHAPHESWMYREVGDNRAGRLIFR